MIVLNMILVGVAVFHIIKGSFYESPMRRFLAVLGFVLAAASYAALFFWTISHPVHPVPEFFIYFGPIVVLGLLFVVPYIRDGKLT